MRIVSVVVVSLLAGCQGVDEELSAELDAMRADQAELTARLEATEAALVAAEATLETLATCPTWIPRPPDSLATTGSP